MTDSTEKPRKGTVRAFKDLIDGLEGRIGPAYLDEVKKAVRDVEWSGSDSNKKKVETLLSMAYDMRKRIASNVRFIENLMATGEDIEAHFRDKGLAELRVKVAAEVDAAKGADLSRLNPHTVRDALFPTMADYALALGKYTSPMNLNECARKRADEAINDTTGFTLMTDYNALPQSLRSESHFRSFIAARSKRIDAAIAVLNEFEADRYAYNYDLDSALSASQSKYVSAANELYATIDAHKESELAPWIPFEDFRREALYRLENPDAPLVIN